MKKTSDERLDKFSQMGIAALLPGMRYMRELMDEEVARLSARLGMAQEEPRIIELKPLGRPKGSKNRKSGWPAGKLAREREAARRRGVALARREAGEEEGAPKKAREPKLHPRDPKHKGHKAWLAKLAKSQKLAWKARKGANGAAAAVIQ